MGKYGKLLKGGEPDVNTVAKMVLNDWQRGKIPFFVPPPGCEMPPKIHPMQKGESFEKDQDLKKNEDIDSNDKVEETEENMPTAKKQKVEKIKSASGTFIVTDNSSNPVSPSST